MSGPPQSAAPTGAESLSSTDFRAMWNGASPTDDDFYRAAELIAMAHMRGQGTMFSRREHVPITHLDYFKPAPNAFVAELKQRDRRSAKEWEYYNAAGVWMELGISVIKDARRNAQLDHSGIVRLLRLAERSFEGALEIITMRGQYFRDLIEKGTEIARQTAFLVEQGHDTVFSENYRSAREALTSRLEIEAAKELAKLQLSQASNLSKQGSSSGSGGSSKK